jgi:CheY-like chemotaxis protein
MRPSSSSTSTARISGAHRTTDSRPNDVLIVEDDDLVRHALKRLLVSGGRECVATASAEDAQQLLTLHAPALVISDLNLGGRLDGIGLLAWMQRSSRLQNVPVVLMTADDPHETRLRLDAAGLVQVDILSKPFEREALARVIANLGSRSSEL